MPNTESPNSCPIYFYKTSDPYGCFSNFSPHRIYLDGQNWLTVEHYYQAQKFIGTADVDVIPLIQGATTPVTAAMLGRDGDRTPRPDWNAVKFDIMAKAVLTKFLSHLDIQAVLLATGDRLIIENSPTDYYWGCGLDRTGQNQLGKILMQVRTEIRRRNLN